MKVLIGCECSGIIRSAFASLGHEAWSCDIKPTEIPGNHIQDDLKNVLNFSWDLGIFHPPCTFLSYCNQKVDENSHDYQNSIKFFMMCLNSPIKRVCVENPVGRINNIIKPTQIIHPYYFGDNFKKRTCLWLKNLPPLIFNYTDSDIKNEFVLSAPKQNRSTYRSKTFPGVAKAMAFQWSGYR